MFFFFHPRSDGTVEYFCKLLKVVMIVVNKRVERGCWARIAQSLNEGCGRLMENVSGQGVRKGNIVGEKLECVDDSCVFGGGYVDKVTSVMVESRTDVPPINGMRCPSSSLLGGFV